MAGHGNGKTQIIKPPDTAEGFQRFPSRWVVERTFAWLADLRLSACNRPDQLYIGAGHLSV
ncbi:transposase [Cohaesibacter haloalkalitolerans]|uniref:transposase n=1 Tax=Cohaesibacter haloalkalitolerans TaxID=1162980 RepID=UPI003CCB46CE